MPRISPEYPQGTLTPSTGIRVGSCTKLLRALLCLCLAGNFVCVLQGWDWIWDMSGIKALKRNLTWYWKHSTTMLDVGECIHSSRSAHSPSFAHCLFVGLAASWLLCGVPTWLLLTLLVSWNALPSSGPVSVGAWVGFNGQILFVMLPWKKVKNQR